MDGTAGTASAVAKNAPDASQTVSIVQNRSYCDHFTRIQYRKVQMRRDRGFADPLGIWGFEPREKKMVWRFAIPREIRIVARASKAGPRKMLEKGVPGFHCERSVKRQAILLYETMHKGYVVGAIWRHIPGYER
jgi:hypothetical protein